VPLLEPARGTSSFEDVVVSPGLFITTDDDLCLFGVGVVRSFLAFGAEYLFSGACSGIAGFRESSRPFGAELLLSGERPDFEPRAMSVEGCDVGFLVSDGRLSCAETCVEVDFPFLGSFLSSTFGLPSLPGVSPLWDSAEDTPAKI
jgi:hypothetical protein